MFLLVQMKQFKKQTHIQLSRNVFFCTLSFSIFFLLVTALKHLLSSKTFHTPCLFLDCMSLWDWTKCMHVVDVLVAVAVVVEHALLSWYYRASDSSAQHGCLQDSVGARRRRGSIFSMLPKGLDRSLGKLVLLALNWFQILDIKGMGVETGHGSQQLGNKFVTWCQWTGLRS